MYTRGFCVHTAGRTGRNVQARTQVSCPLKTRTEWLAFPTYSLMHFKGFCVHALLHLFFFSNSCVSFNETARADAVLGYLIAFLVLLSTVKLWHLLRLNPKLNMITSTLRRAWGDISGFITVIAIMFLAYSIAVSTTVVSVVFSLHPGIVRLNELFLKCQTE